MKGVGLQGELLLLRLPHSRHHLRACRMSPAGAKGEGPRLPPTRGLRTYAAAA